MTLLTPATEQTDQQQQQTIDNATNNRHESGFTPSADISDLANRELLDDSGYHPNLGGVTERGKSNHYPMTILSLAGLGASDADIENFRAKWPRYRAHVSDDLQLQDNPAITLDNWTQYLGQDQQLVAFRRVFKQGLDTDGAEQFVSAAIAKMKHSLPMGLFHPLIQLSFATKHGDHTLIANGLAYMAIRYNNMYGDLANVTEKADGAHTESSRESNSEQQSVTAVQSWAALHHNLSQIQIGFQPMGGTLHVCEQLCGETDIQQAAFSEGFAITVENLDEKIAEICKAAIRLYLSQPALTTLHAVTSAQALAELTMRYDKQPENRAVYAELWNLYWIWLTGLYLEKGAAAQLPVAAEGVESELDSWQKIVEKTLPLAEVHIIKMVYTCKWLADNIEADEIYKVAAMNIVTERNAHPRNVRWVSLESLSQ